MAAKVSTQQQLIDFNRADAEAALLDLNLKSIWVRDRKAKVRVSAKTLKSVIMRICSHQWTSGVCWASATTIAKVLNCHERTVRRACTGLVDLQLLVIKDKRPGKVIRYAINWGEVGSFNNRSNPGHSDGNPGHSDRDPGHSDQNPGHYVRRTLITSKEPHSSHSERSSDAAAPIAAPDPWAVVVSAFLERGMSPDGAFKAVTTAQSRELTPDDAQRLIAVWERLRAHQPHVTIGWLYRWMTGQSRPPEDAREDRSARAPSRSVSLMSDTTRREILRARLWREGRNRGLSEEVIEARFRELTDGELTAGGAR